MTATGPLASDAPPAPFGSAGGMLLMLAISDSKCAREASMLISVVAGWIAGSEAMTMA